MQTSHVSVDRRYIRKAAGRDIYGILGMDFLRKHVVRIDFDAGKMTFLKEVGSQPGQPVPVIWEGDPEATEPGRQAEKSLPEWTGGWLWRAVRTALQSHPPDRLFPAACPIVLGAAALPSRVKKTRPFS